MASFNHHIVHSHIPGSEHSRVKVDEANTAFYLGRQFRSYHEINKLAGSTLYYRFTAPINCILQGVELDLDSGGVRGSSWVGSTFTGTWTALPVIGRNSMTPRPGYPKDSDPPYVNQCTFEVGATGQFTGGTERDVIRVRCSQAQGAQSATGESGRTYQRGLPPAVFGLKLEPITGVAQPDVVLGVITLLWEEVPVML